MKAPRPQALTKIERTISSYLQSTLPILPDLSICSSSSKKCGMDTLDTSIQPPVEPGCPLQKPGLFKLYRSAPVQRTRSRKRGNWWNADNEGHWTHANRVRFANYICPKEGRKLKGFRRLPQSQCSIHQLYVLLTKNVRIHWFNSRCQDILHTWCK